MQQQPSPTVPADDTLAITSATTSTLPSSLPSCNASVLHMSTSNSSALGLNRTSGGSSLSASSSTAYFRSRRIKKDDKASLATSPRSEIKKSIRIWYWLFLLIGLVLGLGVAGFKIYMDMSVYSGVSGYCPVLMEDFSRVTNGAGLREDVWMKEVQVGGFGNGEFQQTTSDASNIFIQNGKLVIKATMQDEQLLTTNATLNLLNNGCTSTNFYDCVATTNTTNGTIINPVKSGRINTKLGASIKYGRVEVVAKLPVGDWLWPAIWMLPTNSVYGAWPASGEIDIMESRGNNYTYPLGGNNVAFQTTHWGPSGDYDMYHITTAGFAAPHTIYPTGFHLFGLEWTEKYLFTYIDTRVRQILYQRFDKPAWVRGGNVFPKAWANGTSVVNPWANASDAAPFDQDFYLVLSLGVGGTNGWFKDGLGGKSWNDHSPTAKLDFWRDRANWYPTWKNQAQMEIKSVKMWQQKGYNGCH